MFEMRDSTIEPGPIVTDSHTDCLLSWLLGRAEQPIQAAVDLLFEGVAGGLLNEP